MMQQYLSTKASYSDCLLFYRMGDFYELFFEDAIKAAEILEITLTKRGKLDAQEIPMCGVPHHSAESYISKLIKAGNKVAICEQMESPEEAKKRGAKSVVKRDVVRIITAGTLTEDSILEAKLPNYLAAVCFDRVEVAIAYVDLSSSQFTVVNSSEGTLAADLSRIAPVEIIICDDVLNNKKLCDNLTEWRKKFVTFVKSFFECKKAENKLKYNFNLHNLDSLGDFNAAQISACGALLEYLCITQRQDKIALHFPKIKSASDYLVIDGTVRRNLELFHSEQEGNSFVKIIDRTITNTGARLLRRYIAEPLQDPSKINMRLNLLEYFIQEKGLRDYIIDKLKTIPDLERAAARIAIGRGQPKDLYMIKIALNSAIELGKILDGRGIVALRSLSTKLLQNDNIAFLLNRTLIEHDLYLQANDFVSPEFEPRIKHLYKLRDESVELINNLRQEYREKTGITTLKLEHNNMLGYYIEVTPTHQNKINEEEFILRQSMVNAKRYTTEKLKKLESEIIGAKDQITLLEQEIYQQLAEQIKTYVEKLSDTALAIAYLDVMVSFAVLSIQNKYCKPIIDQSDEFMIEQGRHPVVEQSLKQHKLEFIANDCSLHDQQKLWLITGPNMAGKSTFLRQNAIIAIMAHMGCFVPAKAARIGVIDRIFSRVGAGDDLAQGRSTFMVEMTETATILNQATNRSLIILDEIGRGTSTYDGMAIAWSCLEYIHNQLGARALFATHFHELTELSKTLTQLRCFCAQVKEWQGKIIFMHKMIEGVASQSYGINVAELAGLPKQVIARAQNVLKQLHKERLTIDTNHTHSSQPLEVAESELETTISNLDLEQITPKQALDKLYELKQLVSK